jgi:hypothetical protein
MDENGPGRSSAATSRSPHRSCWHNDHTCEEYALCCSTSGTRANYRAGLKAACPAILVRVRCPVRSRTIFLKATCAFYADSHRCRGAGGDGNPALGKREKAAVRTRLSARLICPARHGLTIRPGTWDNNQSLCLADPPVFSSSSQLGQRIMKSPVGWMKADEHVCHYDLIVEH